MLRDHDIFHIAYEDIKSSEEKRLELLEFLGMGEWLHEFQVPDKIVNPNASLVSLKLLNKSDAIKSFEEKLKLAPLDTVV